MNLTRKKTLLLWMVLAAVLLLASCARETPLHAYGESLAPADILTESDLIFSKVYCTGSNDDTPLRCGFIELMNVGTRRVSLRGMSLYYASGKDTEYRVLDFPAGAGVEAGGRYLIRCGEGDPDGYLAACEKLTLTGWDADFPELRLSSKASYLVIAPTGGDIGVRGDALPAGAVAYFGARAAGQSGVLPAMSGALNKRTLLFRDGREDWSSVDYAALDCLAISDYAPLSSDGACTEIPLSGVDIRFSQPGGRYDGDVTLEMETLPGYRIVYTTEMGQRQEKWKSYEGSVTVKGRNTLLGPLTLRVSDYIGDGALPGAVPMCGTVLRACVTDGERFGPVQTQTYLISPDMTSYQDTLMLSLTVDSEEFAGENGVYSRVSDDIFAERGRCGGYLEILDPDEGRVAGNYIQLAMNGNGSLGFRQKSMRFYVRGEQCAEDGGTLYYDLFDGAARDADGNVITAFKRFLLRNSGNDCSQSHLRDGVMQSLCADLDTDIQAYRPAMLFINGEFWGVYNLRERYCKQYFASHYGVDENNVVMLESISPLLTGSWDTPYELNDGEEGDEKDFHSLMEYVESHDMEDDACFAYVESKMDTDNYLDYFLASLYFANTDWPGNNIKVWRNKNPDDPSGLDTRWRWVLVDMDFGGGLSTTATQPMLAHAINDNTVCGRLMNHLLDNRTYRMQFIDRCLELMDTALRSDLCRDRAEAAAERIEDIIEWNFKRWPGDGGSLKNWYKSVQNLDKFLAGRSASMRSQLAEWFDVPLHTLTLRFEGAEGSALVNGDAYTETRFFRDGRSVRIAASAPEGYVVTGILWKRAGWGEKLYSDEALYWIHGDTEVTIYCEKAENAA